MSAAVEVVLRFLVSSSSCSNYYFSLSLEAQDPIYLN